MDVPPAKATCGKFVIEELMFVIRWGVNVEVKPGSTEVAFLRTNVDCLSIDNGNGCCCLGILPNI